MAPNPYEAPVEAMTVPAVSFDWRWLVAIPLAAVATLFATLPLMVTFLVLLAFNALAFVALLIARQTNAASLAFLTGILFLASLLFTEWGLSSPKPRIIVSWVSLIPAIIAQLSLIAWPLLKTFTRHTGD